VDDFDEFFTEHYPRVVGSLELAGGAAGDAEDAAQEAFMKAMLRWRSVATMERPATWVYVVAVRAMRRRLGRDRSVTDRSSDERPEADETESVVTAFPRRSLGSRDRPRHALFAGNREVDVAHRARTAARRPRRP
jgi:DNA-directed RNA polymerase specialized sigma24 family protein